MTILVYLAVALYQWDILWIAELATFDPVNRMATFLLTVCFVAMDYFIYKLSSQFP